MKFPNAIYALTILSLLTYTVSASAKMYKWVDEQGQVHYSQRPPPRQEAQRIETITTREEGNLKAVVKDGAVYCGDKRLPFNQKDELLLLADIRSNLDHYRKLEELARKNYSDASRRQAARRLHSNSSTSQDDLIKRYREEIAVRRCTVAWMEQKAAELEPLRQSFLKEAESVKGEYEASKNPCGEPPQGGWKSDTDYQSWAKCITSKQRTVEHNKKLRQHKRYETLRRQLAD